MAYRLDLPDGSFVTVQDDAKPRAAALAEAKAKFPDAFPAPPGVGEQLLGLPAEIGKGFIRGLTVDPASGIASLGYTGARAAGAELTPFEQTGVGKGLASAQRALAPSDEGLITQFGGGLGSLLSFIPGGLLKGGVGLATKLTQAGGVGSEEARARAEEARVMGEADATAGQQFMAQLGGTGVGLTELAPLKFLTEPIEQILRGVPKSQADLIAPTLFNSGKRMLATGGIEGFQEGMANIAQDLIAKGIYNPNLQVGESALGDAAMGASVGAFAQGAIELATRGKRRALYEQFKEQEEAQKQAEAQRIAAEQQALIDAQERQQQQLAMQALGGPQIDPATGQPVLLLGGPAPQVNLQDPLGIRFGEEDLGPKIVRGINRARKEKGLPPTKQFTVEDLMEAGTEKDAPFVSEMLARKTGFDPSVQVSPQSVLEVAQSKNIDVESPGFTDFLRRTTGSADIGSMTAPQLFAAQQSLSALPNFTEPTQLPTGSQATTFDDKTYKKTVDGLKKTVLNSGPLGRSQVIEEIKGFSGLTETRDAERLLETALGRGDLSASPTKGLVGTSINISLPTLPGIGGPDVRRGDYMDSEVTGYEITSEDGKFKQVRPTMTAAENSLAAAQQGRLNTVEKLTDEANRTQLVLESNQEKLAELEQVGETGAQYKKIESNIKNLTSKLNRLNDKIQSASQPLQIKARQTPRSRAGFTLFENGQPVGTYPTQEDAQIAAVRFRTDEELDGIINAAPRTAMEGALEQPFGEQPVQRGTVRSGMARRLYDEAVKEKDRRYRTQAGLPPPAAPVQIKITGDAVAAAERLRAAGLTVRFAPEVEKEVPEINKRLRAVLDRLGLKDVRLNIVESMKVPGFAIYDQRNQLVGFIKQVEPSSPDYAKNMATLQSARASGMRVQESVASANGSYAAKLIEIALDSKEPIRAARHEAIHALKELGFFTPDQWRVLENKAKSEWIKTYQIESRYSDLDQEGRIEEAIADAFSDFDQNKPPVGTIGNLFRKVKAFFEALGNAFRGSGFQTAEEVFTRVEEGRLTGPGAAVAGETKFSLRQQMLEARRAAAGEFNQIDPPQSLIDLYRQVRDAEERANLYASPANKTRATKFDRRLNKEMEAFALQALGREPNYEDIGKLNSRLSQFVDPDFIGEKKHSLNLPKLEDTANVTPLGVQQARIYEKELEALIKKIGDRIVGMKSGETLDNVRKAVKKLQSYTAQGLKGKEWYENSAKAVLDGFNGDPVLAEKFFQIIAITSANTEVAANFTKASKAWEQFAAGKPIKVGTGNENKKIEALLNFGEDWEGRKTNTFYTNLMEAMDGKDSGRSTIDLHMSRMLFDKDAPTEAQYILAENMVRLLASKIGIPARQVQAASWVTQKAKSIFDEYRKKGWKKNLNDDQLREFAFERAVTDYSHLMKARVKELSVTDAMKELSSNIRSRVQNITGEVIPSVKTEMSEVEELAFKDKEKLTKQIAKSDMIQNIAKNLGITSKVRVTVGSGAYAGKVNPNLIVQVVNDNPAVAQQDSLDLANAMSYVFKQDSTPFFRADPALLEQDQLGYGFKFASPLTPTQQKNILSLLTNKFGGDVGFTKVRANEIVIINYRGADGTPFLASDTDFVIGLDEVRNDINAISPIESQEVFGAQSEYPYHEWESEPTGTSIVQGIQDRRPQLSNLQRGLDNLRESFVADARRAVRETGREPKFSLRLDELVGGPGIGSGISIREQQPTAQSFDAVHYGKQPVNTLLGSMYGTGIRGAEAQRVFASEDPRVQQRAYFYIPLTNGRMPMPEAGLGNQVHVQRLNNLLGPGPEMQALVDATRGPDGRMDANAFESAVIDAGYDGYAVPDMGMAVVLDANVPVISRGTRQEVEAMPEEGKIQIGDRKYSLRPIEAPEFKQWFGESKIVNADSTPKVMYHGTARDIGTFIPKRADAIFITDRPRFAEGFADSSEDYMIGKYMESATPEQTSAIIEKAIAKGLKDKDILPSAAKSLREMTLDQASRTVGVGDYIRELVKNELPSGQNIMPLYVRAENPFDYENPQHIRRLAIAGIDDDVTLEEISEGDWEAIESPEVQEVIRDLFDSFYIKEGGVKNLAVYDPNQIKSAIGNIGTFSRSNDDIRYSIALGSLEPRTALIPDLGGNPDGNLGSAPDKFDSKPIRMTVGTHNDIDDKGYGANHILTRVMSDPNRMADLDMSVKEVLERILVTAQKTAQNYSRIYRDPKTKHLAFYTPKNTLIVSQDRDQLSIVSMFKVDKPDQKFGQPLWQGRAPVVPQFVGKIRGTEVEAREGRVQPKAKTEVSVKPKRVYTPTEIEQIAAEETREPTKGTLSLKKKMSLSQKISDGADAIARMPKDVKDNTEYVNMPGGYQSHNLYEARKLAPKPTNKLKKVTENNSETLNMETDYVLNVDGEHYYINLEEDPDDEDAFVYSFSSATDPNQYTTTITFDVDELIKEIRDSKSKAPRTQYSLATAYDLKPVDTESKNFKTWFSGSMVRNPDGSPRVVYHGTQADIPYFDFDAEAQNRTGNPLGFYFTGSPEEASRYAEKPWRGEFQEGANVLPVYLSIVNPFNYSNSPEFRKTPVTQKMVDQFEKELRKENPDLKEDWIQSKINLFKERGIRGGDPFPNISFSSAAKTRVLEAGGYDGMIDGPHFVAFKQGQIKSALSTTGNIDKAFPDIQYSLAGLTPTDSKDNMIYLLQDKNIDLKRVIQAIQKSGKDLADRWNAYLQEELFHGRSATRVRFFMDRELRPFLQKMEAANVSVEQMDDYLLARHAKEANAYIRKINPDPSQNSGMTDKEAEDYMASLPPQRRMTLEKLAKEVDAFTKGTRDLMVDYGLEDRKTINQWEKTYKNYVPLFREEIEEGMPISIGRGYQIRGATTRRRMGSSRKVSDILANIALQRERTIVRGEKNRVGNSLYGLVLDNPNKGFWAVINPEKMSKQALRTELLNLGINPDAVDEMVARPPQRVINKTTGLVSYQVPPMWKNAPNIFATRINGEDRFIAFNEKDERAMRMASTLKNLDAQQQGEAVRMMGTAGDYYRKMIDGTGKVTRYFAQINTQYNPAFGIYNLMRDIGGAVLNLQTTPLKGQEAKVISDALVALKSVYRDLRRQREGLDADSEWAKIFEEFELEGGKTGYRDLFETRESRAEALQKEIEDFNKGTVRSKGKAIMGWLSDFNDAIENSIRVSVYKNAIDKGISKERAASLAKNITVNFNRTGAVSRNFQTLFAFFNASIQGTARIAQTLLTSEGKLSPTGKKIVMGGITLGLMQAVLLAMAGLDDDEVPDFVKDKSFVIPTGDGKYIAIPMPLGYNIIPGFGRRVMEFAMSDDKNVGKAVAETSQMIVDGFNPLGSGTFVQTLTPTALDPIVALAENKDFTGKPISREDINSLSPTPGYTRGSQNSFAVTEALAYAINILSGGTEFKKGVLSPTPDQIEYLVGEALGGVGREALKIGRGVEAIATGEELATYNIPIAGRLVGNVQQQAAQRNRFFENIRRLNEHQAEIEGRMLNGEDINDYLETFPEATMYQVGDKVYSQITKLRQQRKALEAAGVGKEELKVIDEAVLGLMTSLNEIYSSAKQQ